MKTNIFFFIAFCLAIVAKGQSISSSVLSTAGDYYTANGYSLSLTIGEPVIDNYTSGNSKLNTGFQQGIGRRNLNLKFYLEGLFNGDSLNQVNDDMGSIFPVPIADKYSLYLAQDAPPFDFIDTTAFIDLKTSGQSSVSLAPYLTGTSYLVIRNRNHLETWSALPVSLANETTNYDFTDAAYKSYGDNQQLLSNGKFAIYTGDIDQNGVVNIYDLALVFDMLNDPNAPVGYITEDVTGDGVVNIWDLAMVFDNLNYGIGTINPLTAK